MIFFVLKLCVIYINVKKGRSNGKNLISLNIDNVIQFIKKKKRKRKQYESPYIYKLTKAYR